DGFEDGAAVQGANKGFYLPLVAGQFNGVDLVGYINDAAAKNIGHALHFLAFLADGSDLDQHELAFNMRPFRQINHLDDIDQTIQVLGDLLDDFIGPWSHDGHAREGRVFGGRHSQG